MAKQEIYARSGHLAKFAYDMFPARVDGSHPDSGGHDDGAALALYCQAWARWVEAEANLVRYGTVIKSQSGFPIQSPYLAIANKAMAQMARILVEFGMSPSSRTRVSIARPTPPPAQFDPQPYADEPDPRRLFRSVQ